MGEIKLFCLPYAGGSASIYSRWNRLLDRSIKLCPYELPGRGNRHKEPYYSSLQQAVAELVQIIETKCSDCQYAVWGHSMGSIMAYELLCSLQEKGVRLPVHAFFSGRYPPSIKKEERNLHLLSEDEFEKEAVKLGGIPDNLFKIKPLFKTALQTLRADYKLLETYKPGELKSKFNFNISVFAGNEDELAQPEDMSCWKNYCAGQCDFYYFEGGHFYLHKFAEEITQIISDTLVRIQTEQEVIYGG